MSFWASESEHLHEVSKAMKYEWCKLSRIVTIRRNAKCTGEWKRKIKINKYTEKYRISTLLAFSYTKIQKILRIRRSFEFPTQFSYLICVREILFVYNVIIYFFFVLANDISPTQEIV